MGFFIKACEIERAGFVYDETKLKKVLFKESDSSKISFPKLRRPQLIWFCGFALWLPVACSMVNETWK